MQLEWWTCVAYRCPTEAFVAVAGFFQGAAIAWHPAALRPAAIVVQQVKTVDFKSVSLRQKAHLYKHIVLISKFNETNNVTLQCPQFKPGCLSTQRALTSCFVCADTTETSQTHIRTYQSVFTRQQAAQDLHSIPKTTLGFSLPALADALWGSGSARRGGGSHRRV